MASATTVHGTLTQCSAATTWSCSSSCTAATSGNEDDGCGDPQCVGGGCDYFPNDATIDHVSPPLDAGPLPDGALYGVEAGYYLAVDSVNLYWIDQSDNIVSAPKDGSGDPKVISSAPTGGIFALGAADVYYYRTTDGHIGIIPHDGGAETTIPFQAGFPNSELPIGSVLVDDANLYYGAPSSDLVRVPLDGGMWVPTSIGFDAGQNTGTFVEVQNSRETFVVTLSSVLPNGEVFSIDKSSGAVRYLFTASTSQNFGADEAYLYVAEPYPFDAGIQRVQDDGGLSPLVPNGDFGGLALDDASAYSFDLNGLERIDKSDGGMRVLVPNGDEYSGVIAVDDAYVYLVATDDFARSYIARVPKIAP